MLVYLEKGWEIEKETFAEELFQQFCRDVEEKNARVIFEMKAVNRQVVFRVLEKIRENGNADFITLLEAWKAMEVRKVQSRIGGAIMTLKDKESVC